MIRPTQSPSLARFRVLIADRLGLSFDNSRVDALAETLERRSRAYHLEAASYLDQLERMQRGAGEFSTLGAELTIGETYFFRHTEQMRAFAEVVLPDRHAATRGQRVVRILSAGCASGEEAYTLAVLSSEQGLSGSEAPEILGIDINPLAIERAESARYSEWALRETPDSARRQYFRKRGTNFVLVRENLPAVRFRQGNLADEEVLGSATFDIVFCRNVLMYFTKEQAIRALERLAAAIVPGGYLFLGHAETLHGLNSDFELCQAHGAFFYVKKSGPAGASFGRRGLKGSPAGRVDWSKSWLEGVERSTDRSELRERSRKPSDRDLSDRSGILSKRALARAIEAGRWTEALELANRVEAAEVDPNHLVLRAALLTHGGHFDSAEQVCLATLARDERSATAHYLLALLRERQGKYEAALDHDQIAIDLEPAFALPYLHLGLAHLRAKNEARARPVLERAARLLEIDDAWRLLVFGGGLPRSDLVQLCARELERLQTSP